MKKEVIVIYPGFPHYRDGILEELISSTNVDYSFIADKNGYNGLKPFNFDGNDRFYHVKSFKINRFLFHSGLISFILKRKFDGAIVHASPYWPSIILSSILLRMKGIKVYNWTHGILGKKKNLKNYLFYCFFKLFFDGLLLYGNNAKRNLLSYGFKEGKIKVIYNSLDYKSMISLRNSLSESERKKIRSSFFRNPSNFQLFFIGRLTNLKKLDMIIEAVKMLMDENIFVNLLFIGDGDEKQNLEFLIANYGLENQIHFYGASYNEKTNYQLIYSSDCCVAPGEIGLTAMHSLTYGIPVISHNDADNQMPEYESIIPNYNGALFENDNIVDLKDKIKDVMNLKKTNSNLKKNCFEVIDKYYNPYYQIKIIDNLFS